MRQFVARIALVATLAATPLSAQIDAGDFLIADNGGFRASILHLDPRSGILSTVTTLNGAASEMDRIPGTDDVAVAIGNSVQKLSLTTQQLTTIAQLPPVGFTTGLAFDQDGTFLVGGDFSIFRVNGSTVTTAYTPPPWFFMTGIVRDLDTAHFGVALSSFRTDLVRLDRRTGLDTPIRTAASPAMMLTDYDIGAGGFWFGDFGTGPNSIHLISGKDGSTLSSLTLPAASLVTVHQTTGDLITWTDDTITLRDRNGTAKRTWGPFPGRNFLSTRVVGGRAIHGVGPATPGSIYELHLSFRNLPTSPYLAALSLSGMRPGIPIPGHGRLRIVPDGLFALTAGRDIPGVTNAFAGTLDATGSAKARFFIPGAVPRGTHVTVAALALDRSASMIAEVAPPFGLVVQ